MPGTPDDEMKPYSDAAITMAGIERRLNTIKIDELPLPEAAKAQLRLLGPNAARIVGGLEMTVRLRSIRTITAPAAAQAATAENPLGDVADEIVGDLVDATRGLADRANVNETEIKRIAAEVENLKLDRLHSAPARPQATTPDGLEELVRLETQIEALRRGNVVSPAASLPAITAIGQISLGGAQQMPTAVPVQQTGDPAIGSDVLRQIQDALARINVHIDLSDAHKGVLGDIQRKLGMLALQSDTPPQVVSGLNEASELIKGLLNPR